MIQQVSACTAKIIGDYFVNGTVPKSGTKCEVESVLFPDEDAEDDASA